MRRLRPYPTEKELDELYVTTYDHTQWEDHKKRVTHSVERLHELMTPSLVMGTLRRVADLSCGDGTIINSFKSYVPKIKLIKGDFVPNDGLDFVGRIEDTLDAIEPVDLFILTETIEHLEDPGAFLVELRKKTRWLFLTTPIGEVEGYDNPEHIWEWNVDDMKMMLNDAGFTGECELLVLPHYTYQIWTCR